MEARLVTCESGDANVVGPSAALWPVVSPRTEDSFVLPARASRQTSWFGGLRRIPRRACLNLGFIHLRPLSRPGWPREWSWPSTRGRTQTTGATTLASDHDPDERGTGVRSGKPLEGSAHASMKPRRPTQSCAVTTDHSEGFDSEAAPVAVSPTDK